MARGIQPGTEAGSQESKQLDGSVRRVAEAISRVQTQYYYESGHRNLGDTYLTETRERAQLPELAQRGIRSGCVPDGGMWFTGDRNDSKRKLVAVFEAKHQQDGGNAQERWATNRAICQSINPRAVYVTFATGEGAQPGGVLHTYGGDMTQVFPNTEWIYSPDGFSEEQIFEIMISRLGLKGITFDQISQYIVNPELPESEPGLTPEQQLARIEQCQQIITSEVVFTSMISQGNNPVSAVWRKLAGTDKAEARDIIIDMIREGRTPTEIAIEVRRLYC